MFISLEGIDGCGKSTQARLLAEALQAEGRTVRLTREPGGSPGAEEIRRMLVEGRGDRWSAETELLLFTAARRDHIERVIRPALAAGEVVITDRFADSTRVYQGEARADLRAMVEALHSLAIGIEPDRTFILDLEPSLAARRASQRAGDEARFESLGVEFQRRLRDGFLRLASDWPDRIRVIDARGDAASVAARIRAAL